MPDHAAIYRQEAAKYDELIAKQPDLSAVLRKIKPFQGLDIVDMGAGTGRLSAILAPEAHSIVALDASEAMLEVTASRLCAAGLSNWRTQQADHRSLPLPDRSADLIVAGWTICYLANTGEREWEHHLAAIMAELERVLRPGGTIIILETMGTGTETPNPPAFLLPYYAALTERYGFRHSWMRTDYTFDSPEQAEALTRFFFGDLIADRVKVERLRSVPECAGIWVKSSGI
ncbi:class I SAM-dependent methyltransferase [Paenibacillus koleovorans]|uniref:class I SAM-dependent methyltransferase n=1 Tax=Paenibacillus koleovorans TaxID=121608 RepID=UPI000FD91BBF|nr:class I SAM-dependent methyltransferase [Paenibacillus koleovorans]